MDIKQGFAPCRKTVVGKDKSATPLQAAKLNLRRSQLIYRGYKQLNKLLHDEQAGLQQVQLSIVQLQGEGTLYSQWQDEQAAKVQTLMENIRLLCEDNELTECMVDLKRLKDLGLKLNDADFRRLSNGDLK